MNFVRDVVAAVKKVLPGRRPIEHHEPWNGLAESAEVEKCLRDDFCGYSAVKDFENKLRAICGTTQVLAMCNGTAALHMALVSSGVKPGDEVLMPAMTFVGTANAVCHAGAVPHFIDSGLIFNPYKLRQYLGTRMQAAPDKRGCINPRTGRRINKFILTHVLGLPSDTVAVAEIANSFGIDVIEDAAEALGTKVGDRSAGSIGLAGVLSFNNNKIVTTNGGGALLTNDEYLLSKAWQLSTTARVPHKWEVLHDEVAWNYRMPNICAALGVAQLRRLPRILEEKRKLAESYRRSFIDIGGVTILGDVHCHAGKPNNWLVPMKLDFKTKQYRNEILEALHAEGIKARAIFTPLHKLPMFKDNPCSCVMTMANDTYESVICLPSGSRLVQ